MFGLVFLGSDKKKLLEKYQNQLTKAATPTARNEIQLAIQEVMDQAKPYTECDLVEADELRGQLLQKISILRGLGKLGSAEPFLIHLKDVEFHIQTLQMQAVLREETKMPYPDEPPNIKDKTPTINSEKREKKKKQAFGLPRWTVDFEDEPKDLQ